MKGRVDSCAYCGAPNAGTMDHLPPVSMFPPPKPSNLISIPCCEQCRRGWSKDDEYFRLAVVSCASLFPTPARDSVNEAVLRSMRREQSKKFARFICESLTHALLTNNQGVVVGESPAINIVKGCRKDRPWLVLSGDRKPTTYGVCRRCPVRSDGIS